MSVDSKQINSEELQKELEIYKVLKPYIGHCLALNHDLNNPLAGVIGYSEFLLDDDTIGKEQKEFITQILTCAERMQQIIENLCEEKISLDEKMDLSSVVETYQNSMKKLD